MNGLVAILPALATPAPFTAPTGHGVLALQASGVEICGVDGADAVAIRATVTAKGGVAFRETIGSYDTCIDEGKRRFWTFVRPESARPPAVVCRTIEQSGTGSRIGMEILCLGSSRDCDALKDEWQPFAADLLPG